jgi:hypothetical protein
MKKFIGIAASLMAALMVNGISAWNLHIESSRFNLKEGKPKEESRVRVDTRFASAFCSDDTFFLNPGESKSIGAGICDLMRVHVNYPNGVDMTFNNNTGNPVGGLGIITINRGQKNNRGESLEKYKVVPLEVMRADDRRLAEKAGGQRG